MVELLWGIENAAAHHRQSSGSAYEDHLAYHHGGRYNLDKKTREFDFSNEDILCDLKFPEKPRTVFGYVAAGLRKRMAANAGPLTILSCDNLPHNGEVCRNSFLSFFEKADMRLCNWGEGSCKLSKFHGRSHYARHIGGRHTEASCQDGHEDLVPVYCEDFVQWVIEGRFPGGAAGMGKGGRRVYG